MMSTRRRLMAVSLKADDLSDFIYKDGYIQPGREFSDLAWIINTAGAEPTLMVNGTFTDDTGVKKTALVLSTTDEATTGAAGISCVETTGWTGAELKAYRNLKVECSLTAATLMAFMALYSDVSGGYNVNRLYTLHFNGEGEGYVTYPFYNTVFEIPLSELSLDDTARYYLGFRSQTAKATAYSTAQELCITKIWLE